MPCRQMHMKNEGYGDMNFERYVNTGIPSLFRKVCAHGANVSNLKVKIVGGQICLGLILQIKIWT